MNKTDKVIRPKRPLWYIVIVTLMLCSFVFILSSFIYVFSAPVIYNLNVKPIVLGGVSFRDGLDVYDWVYENIKYSDNSLFGKFSSNVFGLNPDVILSERKGICTQQAIVACSLAVGAGFNCSVETYYVLTSKWKFIAHAYPCISDGYGYSCYTSIG